MGQKSDTQLLIEAVKNADLFRLLFERMPQGEGSGLDADKLDGNHYSDFLELLSRIEKTAGRRSSSVTVVSGTGILAKGTATILTGATSAVSLHGLASAPNIGDIVLVAQDDLQGLGFWPSDPTGTTFQINLMTPSPVDHVFSWFILGTSVDGSSGSGIPSNPPEGGKKVTNIWYDSVTQEFVFEHEP